jgi:hypothetical protein
VYKLTVTQQMETLAAWMNKFMPKATKPKSWKHNLTPPTGLPQQINRVDCGVFVYKYMERISAGRWGIQKVC